MTYRSNAIPQRMREAAAYAFQEVPHVHLDRIGWNRTIRGRHPVPVASDNYMLQVIARGWSPTLHTTLVQHDIDLSGIDLPGLERRRIVETMMRPDDEGVDMLVRLMLAGIEMPIALQHDRAQRAAALGIRRPLRTMKPSAIHDGGRMAVGHVHIDRSVALLLSNDAHSETEPLLARKMVEHAIAAAHRTGSMSEYEVDVQNSAITRVFLHDWDGVPVADLGVALGGGVSFFGPHLRLPMRLPETVIAVCAGRALADVVDPGTGIGAADLFAGRTIVSAKATQKGVQLTLAPDMVRVDDVWPLAPRRTSIRKAKP